MKNLLLLLILSMFNLEAVPPKEENKEEFKVSMKIEKITNGASEVIAEPKLIIFKGEPTNLTIQSAEKKDILSIQITFPDQP